MGNILHIICGTREMIDFIKPIITLSAQLDFDVAS